MTTTDHLNSHEMDEALAFKLSDERAEHLTSCHGCQQSVQWQRLAKLGQLRDDDHDWSSRTIEALSERAKQTGRAFVYFVPEYGRFVWRVMFPFQKSRIIKIW